MKKKSPQIIHHKELAAGRWAEMPFVEQMANIGSEVGRAIHWKSKNNAAYGNKAFGRALELIDLTLDAVSSFSRRKEVARLREAFVDYYLGANDFASTEDSWKKYFFYFACVARKD